jgi:poly(glycerol-phosphate) alpha-glucosyltransferase
MQSLVDTVKKLGVTQTVQFIGGQFDKEKEACFIDADAFILPSFSEGLPMAVLEAWSYRLPVIMTSFCNIPEGFEKGAALSIDTSPEGVASGIQELVSLSAEQRLQMGTNGYNLVKERFVWDNVARCTIHMYEWIAGKADKPDFIYQ